MIAGKLLGRTLHDITQILESADGADERVRRVLVLLRALVPYDRCAILEGRLGFEPRLVLIPEAAPGVQALLTETLVDIFGHLVDPKVRPSSRAARLEGVHLAVPLVGLDDVIGLLFVHASGKAYTEDHLRALSLVAAKLAAYLTMLRSRSEHAELARERDEARRVAEAANRTQDEFLALVSRQLKAPLEVIRASARALRARSGDAAARSRAIDELDSAAIAQGSRIDELLDLASVTSATLRLNRRAVEPAGLIRATLERLGLEAERKSVRLESNLDTRSMSLSVDPDRIGQVLSALVAAAIQSTPVGGHVEVRLERLADTARIQVRDTGRGLRGEALARVFDRFRPTPGADAGFGLAIVKDLVELHGGRVHAESEGPEHGSTFTVELPLSASP